jgi:hypothetical protein
MLLLSFLGTQAVAVVKGQHIVAEGDNYLDLTVDQDADTTKVEVIGPQVVRLVEGARAVVLRFKTDTCAFRPGDQVVMQCQPKDLNVTLKDDSGQESTTLTVGKVYWGSLNISRLHEQFVDPTHDRDQLRWEVNFAADKIPGTIAYLNATSIHFSVKPQLPGSFF